MKRTDIITIVSFSLVLTGIVSCDEGNRKRKDVEINETASSKISVPVGDGTTDTTDILQVTAKNCDQTFDDFFERFAKDSSFQKNRVKYPMNWFFYGNANYQTLEKEVINSKDKFRYFDLTKDKEAIKREYGAFKIEKTKFKDSLIYKRTGLDSGLLMSFKFSLIDDCWYLVEILDEST